MPKAMPVWVILFCTLIGCGPQTIFVRPGLDTPYQHVSNGYQLLDQEKWEDARREFERAKDLDPFYTEAFVGLAIAHAGKGDAEYGFKLLEDARSLSTDHAEQARIQKAYEQLQQISGNR